MHLGDVWQCRKRGSLGDRREHLAQKSVAVNLLNRSRLNVSLRVEQRRVAGRIGVTERRQNGDVLVGKILGRSKRGGELEVGSQKLIPSFTKFEIGICILFTAGRENTSIERRDKHVRR